jgi:translation elongation factor EF-4
MKAVVFKDRTVVVSNPTEFPEVTNAALKVKAVQEPVVKASIIFPKGAYDNLCNWCY